MADCADDRLSGQSEAANGGEDCYEKADFLFCAVAPDCDEDPPKRPTDEADLGGVQKSSAVVNMASLWIGDAKGVQLKVYFINPEVAAIWNVTTDRIIEWANEWNKKEYDEIPLLEETKDIDRAQIRVELSEKKGCWSKVGTNAKKVKKGKPTMVLNLGSQSGCKGESCKRSLVIHEFGHALGLEHEHQRSDFWDVVKKHLNLKTMKNDKRVTVKGSDSGEASYGKDWFEKEFKSKEGVQTSKYDPESIMHYGFDVDWIDNPDYRKLRNLMSNKTLPPKEKEYLIGINKRNKSLAIDPSKTDLEGLEKAYGVVKSSP